MSPIDLDAAPLVDLNTGAKLCGADLFKEPVFVVAFRRPGCMLCRDEALKMIRLKSTLRDIGVGLVGLLHEDLDEQARSCPITCMPSLFANSGSVSAVPPAGDTL